MWWGLYSSRNGRSRWRSSGSLGMPIGPLIDQRDETRIEPDMSDAELDVRLSRRVTLRRQQRRDFVGGLFAFTGVNLLLWAIWLFSDHSIIVVGLGDFQFPWPLFVTLFWGIGVLAQGYGLYQNSAAATARRETATQRAIELERAQLGLARDTYEKPKRDGLESEKTKHDQTTNAPDTSSWVRLSDDGELVPFDDGETGTDLRPFQENTKPSTPSPFPLMGKGSRPNAGKPLAMRERGGLRVYFSALTLIKRTPVNRIHK